MHSFGYIVAQWSSCHIRSSSHTGSASGNNLASFSSALWQNPELPGEVCAARGTANCAPALGRGGQPSAAPTQADVQARWNSCSSSATRRRVARGAAGRAPTLLHASQSAAFPSQLEVQAEWTTPPTGQPPPTNPPNLTIASLSLEQLMDAVRQEMQVQ